jgi:hypothetical protein
VPLPKASWERNGPGVGWLLLIVPAKAQFSHEIFRTIETHINRGFPSTVRLYKQCCVPENRTPQWYMTLMFNQVVYTWLYAEATTGFLGSRHQSPDATKIFWSSGVPFGALCTILPWTTEDKLGFSAQTCCFEHTRAFVVP